MDDYLTFIGLGLTLLIVVVGSLFAITQNSIKMRDDYIEKYGIESYEKINSSSMKIKNE